MNDMITRLMMGYLINPRGQEPIIADAYEDAGEVERAEFIRVQCRLDEIGPEWKDDGPRQGLPVQCRNIGGREYLLECYERPPVGARVDVEVTRWKKKDKLIPGLRVISVKQHPTDGDWLVNAVRDEYSGKSYKQVQALRERELELLESDGRHWSKPLALLWWPKRTNPLYAIEYGHSGCIHPSRVGEEVRWKWTRGFVSSLTLSAEDWLAHHESLFWHPGQTTACPECVGRKGYIIPDGATHRTPANATTLDEYWASASQDWRGQVRTKWEPCDNCSGTGRVPRPFVATAQPLTDVRLTTWPNWDKWHADYQPFLDPIDQSLFRLPYWPGITFHLPMAAGHRPNLPSGERAVA